MADMNDVLGLILGGGRGTRLYPLTQKRAKPAVPIAGKYRLIDIPISNCLHADINKIAILTQFKSASLHRHILRTYQRDNFSDGWVEILAAEQSLENINWYQGTADAVRKQWAEIKNARTRYTLILAGDHLYRMDYRRFVQFHIEAEADITLAVQPVEQRDAPAFGILKRRSDGLITRFQEKPAPDELGDLASLPDTDKPYLGSMGIYVISTDLLYKILQEPGDDFGKDIIPRSIETQRVMGYVFDGYWADIGTIRRFYEVNLELATSDRPIDLFDPRWPVYTRPRFLPPSDLDGCHIDQVLLADGCYVHRSNVSNSVIGLRSIVGPNVAIDSTVMMGADYYETEIQREENIALGRPDIGIGAGTVIEGAILDKNARSGRNVIIRLIPDRPDSDAENWVARDGLVIVPKNAVIPDDTVI
ncbi:MAG: glucose-1-phosphate adenylyltransferase [Chloroflexota bacterium]